MTAITPASLLQMRSAILQQNSALQKAAGAGVPGVSPAQPAAATSFTGAMKTALAQVNDFQAKADTASTSYEKGETTDIAAVMLAREQASVGFQATLQVRNKLLSAYKDIMSMPV
ncbi:flagellar hook-basal body complex protein FliE [Sphingomonas bacterium]|uniref:flagellar hook-basal body complex protein FliE n=1 Tax=Sphingomonas bacterium TaxID=1895847 RepID=UPI001574F082|nr:flagellar hook-basal body complex protein FliE [Sphingomonas bacterium]